MNRSLKPRKKVKKQVAPNILKQSFNTELPNDVWTSDISYIKTSEGWLYLAVIMDFFSRKILGMAMDKYMSVNLKKSYASFRSRQSIYKHFI